MYTILIVEDEPDMAELMAEMVEDRGDCDAVLAQNGVAALDVLRKYQRGFGLVRSAIDCILLDWRMPKMNGPEFLKALRIKEHKRMVAKHHIPVIMTSAYHDLEKLDIATDPIYGMAAAYLVKPVEQDDLNEKLDRILIDNQANELVTLTRDAHEAVRQASLEHLRDFA